MNMNISCRAMIGGSLLLSRLAWPSSWNRASGKCGDGFNPMNGSQMSRTTIECIPNATITRYSLPVWRKACATSPTCRSGEYHDLAHDLRRRRRRWHADDAG